MPLKFFIISVSPGKICHSVLLCLISQMEGSIYEVNKDEIQVTMYAFSEEGIRHQLKFHLGAIFADSVTIVEG